ncbi:MAG: hypothetical protein QM529_03240 [Hydrotalea sp.]|nr:hypothetical protein [Hydrotalea sp.]
MKINFSQNQRNGLAQICEGLAIVVVIKTTSLLSSAIGGQQFFIDNIEKILWLASSMIWTIAAALFLRK